jgi:hypothetical protein
MEMRGIKHTPQAWVEASSQGCRGFFPNHMIHYHSRVLASPTVPTLNNLPHSPTGNKILAQGDTQVMQAHPATCPGLVVQEPPRMHPGWEVWEPPPMHHLLVLQDRLPIQAIPPQQSICLITCQNIQDE